MSDTNSSPLRAMRKKTGMNQADFWARVGVTQSGGCRYESGRNIPRPVQILLTIAYGTDRQASKQIESIRGCAVSLSERGDKQ